MTTSPYHEVGQVGLGDLGAHRQLAADHQTDLDLVVQQLHVLGFDDVIERADDRAGRLAEEGQRRLGGVAADVLARARRSWWPEPPRGMAS